MKKSIGQAKHYAIFGGMSNAKKPFQQALEQLEFVSGKSKSSNLLFTKGWRNRTALRAKELFTLELAEIHKADAVYFRRFPEGGREPLPQIFIYDNSKGKHTDDDIAHFHRNLWSSCLVPMFMVIHASNVAIYDCRKPVTVRGEKITSKPIDTLGLHDKALREFYSARLLDNGTFWEQQKFKNHFRADATAYKKLIDGLSSIRSRFLNDSNLDEKFVHKLLLHCILIKYLEERGNGAKKKFAEKFFLEKLGYADFCEILVQGKALDAFDALSEQFNGKVFTWDKQEEAHWRKLLKTGDFSRLAFYLNGKITTGDQPVFWSEFSFKHLPVELISSIYEAFLKDVADTTIVYTPDHLVSLMVDECMPPDEWKDKEDFKILDGSCGSGIFLVKTFKRMVEWRKFKNFKEGRGADDIIGLNELKQLLRDNIFGIELKADAAQLSIFSLAVALCDELKPAVIWDKLKFDDLIKSKNIRAADFFSCIGTDKGKYDLVIGNPPFEEYNSREFQHLLLKYSITPSCKIPQNQIALLFLQQAMLLLKKNARLCLIMPAGPLLYNNTLDFRKDFFKQYNVEEVLDFTNLSAVLFEGQANVPVVALYAQNCSPNKNDIAHITINRTKSAKDKIYFEIDHYDYHPVGKADALQNEYVWKANLLGGGRVLDIVKRYEKYQTIGEFLKEKKKDGWVNGEGYIVGHDGSKPVAELIKKKYYKNEFLKGQHSLITDGFTEEGIGKDAFEKEDNLYYRRPRNPKLFEPPFIMIKELFGEKRIPIYFSDKPFIYKHQITGIAAPSICRTELQQMYSSFNENNDLYRFLIAITSNHFLISWASAISKASIMGLPYLVSEASDKVSMVEKILRQDVSEFIIEFLRKGESSRISKEASTKELQPFINTYCKVLNSVYQEGKKEFKCIDFVEGPAYYAITFQLTNKAAKPDFAKTDTRSLEKLLEHEHGSSARIKRVIRMYQKGQKITLVKPKQLRYWLRSIALRDADETLDEAID